MYVSMCVYIYTFSPLELGSIVIYSLFGLREIEEREIEKREREEKLEISLVW